MGGSARARHIRFDQGVPALEVVRARLAEVLLSPVELIEFPAGFGVHVATRLAPSGWVRVDRRGDALELELNHLWRDPGKALVCRALADLSVKMEHITPLWEPHRKTRFDIAPNMPVHERRQHLTWVPSARVRFEFVGPPPSPETVARRVCELGELDGSASLTNTHEAAFELRVPALKQSFRLVGLSVEPPRILISTLCPSCLIDVVSDVLTELGGDPEPWL